MSEGQKMDLIPLCLWQMHGECPKDCLMHTNDFFNTFYFELKLLNVLLLFVHIQLYSLKVYVKYY